MEANEPQRRNADASTDNDRPGSAYCIVCSVYKPLSAYSLHVRRWDGRYVAKANICTDCVAEEHSAWHYNRVADLHSEGNQ